MPGRGSVTAGDFRNPVLVRKYYEVPDDSGGWVKSWQDAFIVWCSIQKVSKLERYADGSMGRVRVQGKYRFFTWYRTDLDEKDVLVFDGIGPLNIVSVDNVDSRNKYLEIVAEDGVEL